MMIIIDPGHGGLDPGGGTNNNFKEKDITLKISKYQNNRLNELNIPSKLSRTYDQTLSPLDRINKINTLSNDPTDILISNHINNGGSNGGEVIYSINTNNVLPSLIAKKLKETGLKIRNVYQKTGKSGKDYYYVLRDSKPNNKMIIEYGFADNIEDANRILYEWPNLSEKVVEAIANYLNVPYRLPSNIIYIVKPNDSLYSISKKFNKNIDEIKTNNNLTSDTIYPLMELII